MSSIQVTAEPASPKPDDTAVVQRQPDSDGGTGEAVVIGLACIVLLPTILVIATTYAAIIHKHSEYLVRHWDLSYEAVYALDFYYGLGAIVASAFGATGACNENNCLPERSKALMAIVVAVLIPSVLAIILIWISSIVTAVWFIVMGMLALVGIN